MQLTLFMGNCCCLACSCPQRWTEGVRKEWLTAVPVGREDEGAADPLRTPDPHDDVPLTGTHSREEIESLIHARCDLGCQVSREDLAKDYVNPESLAIELERELLALKLHVARSHALLHHYQSSSLHGSRSEVSTPPVATIPHVQGVEAGVEADLCGPTCIPRPCDSTATQTPASPISASPECEVSTGEEANGSAGGSNDVLGDDLLQDDHRPLTPSHRPLYQRMSVSEEEVEEESGCGQDMAVPSDHAIYSPKPTYDQLDQYSSHSKRSDEKQRRSGLVTIKPQVSGGGGESSDSEEERSTTNRKLSSGSSSRRHHRPALNRHLRCHSDSGVTPLSPPPSLDKEEDEEEDLVEKEEEEPELPSTPESGRSNVSAPPELFTSTARVMISNIKEEDDGDDDDPVNRSHLSQVTVISTTTTTTTTTVVPSTSSEFSAASPTATNEIQEGNEDANEESSSPGTNVFPSLQDSHLRAAGISVHDPPPNENLSSQEIENKFKQISLAFKTDRLTLRQRLDVQQRQRDIAELNFERELDHLKSSILALHEDCIDMELVDAVMQVRKHLDVLTTSSSSLLSASEVWGAVQQEWRVSRALEVLLLHVENVKRLYEHDHQELEEMRRLLTEHQIEFPVPPGAPGSSQSSASESVLASRRFRALSLAGVGRQIQESGTGNRRISLVPGSSKTLKDFQGGRSSRRRASLMPDLRPFHQESMAAIAAAAVANAAKDKAEEKRHSTNGMLGSSITEEGSESGDEGTTNTGPGTNDNSPTATPANNLTHFPLELYGQDSDQRSSEDGNSSPVHTSATESLISNHPTTSPVSRSQHWLMLGMEDVLGWVRGGRWPYSPQQTYQGARYAFTSVLLLLAAFFLLLTISSGNDGVYQPCPPGWTTIHHRLHPFVTVHCLGAPPT